LLRDWETKILGLGDNVVYSKENFAPRDKIEAIIRKSMKTAGITGDVLIEDNAKAIFTAFSTLFRARSKTVINSIKSTEFIDVNTSEMRDETRGISSFRSDSMLFYTDEYKKEMPTDEQKAIIEAFVEDDSFPRRAYTEINHNDFKTPLNTVIATAEPEYQFLKKYLLKNENAQKIQAWVKSRDMGFYSIEYSYKQHSHTKVGTFNPDFIIKLAKEYDTYLFIEIKDNGDNTSTISNDKGSITVDTANITNEVEGTTASTDPTDNGTNTITKTGKVDYKYVTAEGNTVLEENKNQDSGADKTIETPYDVYGKSGEVFKGTTGGDAEASDLDNAKETGKKETIEKDGKTYHLIGEPKVETTGDGAGVYSDTTLGDVTAKLTPEGLNNAEGKITYDTVKAGGKAWIVEQTGKGTYGKYVQADSGTITSDAKMVEAFKAGEAAAKNFTSANVTTDGGIKEGDYVFVLEKNTYVTVSNATPEITGVVPLSPKDNIADDEEGSGASIDRTYAMVQKFKAAPDTATGEANRTFVKNYLAYLQEKGLEDNTLNFKRYISVGIAAKGGEKNAIKVDTGDQVDDKGRPTTDVTANFNDVYENNSSKFGDDINLNLGSFNPEIEEYSYRDEITPLRAYRLASGTTTITYTYAEEKTREIEKKGSVVVNYQTEDGTELKVPYTDTPETVAEVVTEHYYVDADGQEVVVEDKTVRTPKNVAYNTKKSADEKPQKLTDAQGNVYYLKADATKTAVNNEEKDAPAEEGTVVEGVTKVTYVYEKAGSVIVNYKIKDGDALTGTVVGDESKTVA